MDGDTAATRRSDTFNRPNLLSSSRLIEWLKAKSECILLPFPKTYIAIVAC